MSSYLELLNLTREPFSNSPDPDAYYRTPTHEDCLNRLEIAIRLRRGLNVVLGEVGTGKSTLCRCLLRSLDEQSGIDVFLLLDAGFEDADEFVRHLCELFAGQRPPEGVARRECISVIQNRVFDKALEQNRNLVLFIDEGQKLSPAALEVLRELLNFETNTEKLLQIVIFGQPELAQIIEGMPNFKDRINEYLYLKPLSMRESIRLVRHRLRLAGGQRAERLFSLGSLIALHRASRGKPRQLMRLGHQMLLALLVGNRTTVTGRMVWSQVARNGSDVETRWGRWLVVALALICVAGGYRWMPEAVKDDAHARLEAVVSGVLGWLPEAEKADTAGTAGQGRAAGDDAVRRAASREAVPQPLPPDEAPPAVPEKAESSTRKRRVGSAEAKERVPETLGTFRLQPGEAFAELVRALQVPARLELVLGKNPGYRTISAQARGSDASAVLYAPPPSMTKGVLLSLGAFGTLEEAYTAWRGYGKRSPSVALTPIWRPGEGLSFHILAPRGFASERAAWSWLSRFSPPAEASVRLLPPFDGACLVFH
ncbi:MAG: ExeA family protein, partial [Bilophila wadsworthia]